MGTPTLTELSLNVIKTVNRVNRLIILATVRAKEVLTRILGYKLMHDLICEIINYCV